MWETRKNLFRKFKPDIDKPTDSPLESAIKKIIKRMIKFRPADRMSITEVVNELLALREATPRDAHLAVDDMELWVRTRSVNRQGMLVSSWQRQSNIPTGLYLDSMCSCRVSDGIVCIGSTDLRESHNFIVRSFYHFSLLTYQWRRLPDRPTAHSNAAAVALGNILLVFGGSSRIDACEKFHMTHFVWSSAAPMKETLYMPFVTTAGGKVFIVPRDITITHGTKIQQYDPTADQFSWAAQLPDYIQSTRYASLVAAADKLYLFGGHQRLAVQYSPAADQWVQLLSKPFARYNWGCCAVVRAGKILLCGGQKDDDAHNMVEEYDMETQQWKTANFKLPFHFWWRFSHVVSIDL